MKTMTLSALKPRNPLVAAARLRKAGVHRPGGGARRRQARQALRREIENLPRRP